MSALDDNPLHLCSYRDLQQLAKSLSLPSNVKKINLIEMIHAKKNYSTERLVSIVTRIKEERKQAAKPRKVNKRNKKNVQGTEISSTVESSPPICTTPTANSNRTNRKHHNILNPLIAKRNVESDRVLRSYNNRLRRNTKYIMNYNNNVVDVQAQNNEVKETRYEWNMELQSYRAVRSDAIAQRHSSVQTDYVVRQRKPASVDTSQSNVESRKTLLVPANYPSGAAKRERRLSGIYPLEVNQPCYQAFQGVGFRNQDGRLSSIKALVQKTAKISQQSIINSQIEQTLVRKRLIQKPIVVSLRGALRPKIIKNRNANDNFSNSSTESAGESSNDREFAPKMITNKSFQETFEKVTFGENRNSLIRDFSMENARKQAEVQKYSNAVCAVGNLTVNKKRTWRGVDTQMYVNVENQTRRANTEAYGSEKQNWRVGVERIETGNNTWPALGNQTRRSGNETYALENRTRLADNKAYAPETQRLRQNNHLYAIDNRPRRSDNGTYAPEKPTWNTNNKTNTKPHLARRLDYDAYATGNQTTRIDKAYATETQRREANKMYAIENHNKNRRAVVYAQKQSIPIDKTNATYNQTMRTNGQKYATEKGTNRVQSSRSATNNNFDKNRTDFALDLKKYAAKNFGNKNDKAYVINTNRTENGAYAIDISEKQTATKSSEIKRIKNQPNRGGNKNRDAVIVITDRDEVDHPNMSALIDIDIGQTKMISQASTEPSDSSTEYYHKKLRAEQVTTQRLSVPKESQPTSSLPRITEVFSQFQEPNFNNITQAHVDDEDESTKEQYTTDGPLESLYNYKPSELEQTYFHPKISAPESFSVYSTHTTATAVAGEASSIPEQGDTPGQLEEQSNIVSESIPQLDDYVFDYGDKCDAGQLEEQCNIVSESIPQLDDYIFDYDDKCDAGQLEEQCNIVSESIPQLDDYVFDYGDKFDVDERETIQRLKDYLMDTQADTRDDVCAQSPNSDFSISSSINGGAESIEEVLDFISQDGDYMERIGMDARMQCLLCEWAGLKGILEYHIRHEHERVIVPRSTSTWSTSLFLARAGSRALSELYAHIYVLTLARVGNDCCRAHITTLPNDGFDRQKSARLTVYNKKTGEPHVWQGLIKELPDSPDEDQIEGLNLDLSALNLLPNSANVKLVNGEWVMDSSSKVVVGPLELNDIEIEVHVEILD